MRGFETTMEAKLLTAEQRIYCCGEAVVVLLQLADHLINERLIR